MIQDVKFSCTALAGTNKAGVIKADADGYYPMPIGGLNCFNSAGEYYPYQSCKNLFEQSSAFMRRVSTGCLKGEYGHPKRQVGMSMEEYARRIMSIEEKSICVHFKEIWLDFNSMRDANGRPIVAVMAAVKPSGPYADALERSLNNPKEDVCFSIRAFTDDVKVAGVNNRNLVEIVTWDFVNEPGINTARKYKAPALESLSQAAFTKEEILGAVKPVEGVAMESSAIQAADAIFRAFGWDKDALASPKFMGW